MEREEDGGGDGRELRGGNEGGVCVIVVGVAGEVARLFVDAGVLHSSDRSKREGDVGR